MSARSPNDVRAVMMSGQSGTDAASDGVGGRRHWFVVALLMLIGVLNYLDRVLPAILAEPIKNDLGLSDTGLGVINGLVFLVVYALACVPVAKLSDRGAYRNVIVGSLSVWSVMTMIGGVVQSGWQFAVSRVGVAAGEAGGTPAAHAYISRHIPPGSRAIALSIFTLCLPVGAMAGFIVGGYVGQALGWRWTFILMGLIGVVLAVATRLILGTTRRRESGKEASAKGVVPPLWPLFRKKSLVAMLIGTSFVGMSGYTAMTFTSSFLIRSHDLSLAEAGLTYGLGGGLAAIVTLLLVGVLSDHLAKRDPRWILGTVVILLVLCLPLSVVSFLSNNYALAVIGLSLNHAVAIAYAAPIFTALHRVAPLALRARVSALVLLSTSILGSLGPVVAGAISDALSNAHGEESLRYAMLIVPLAYAFAAMWYAIAIRYFKGDLVVE